MAVFKRFLILLFFCCNSIFASDYELFLGPNSEIFPSTIIATSNLKADMLEPDPTVIGDNFGSIGILIEAPSDNAIIRIELQGQKLFSNAVFEGVLPKKGIKYGVFPYLKYNMDLLNSNKQPFIEVISAKVSINGKPEKEKSGKTLIRSINDCLLLYTEDNEHIDTYWILAAYVNENHPEIEKILGEALAKGRVEKFAGYLGSSDDVMEELEAIWDTLKARGLKYSNITRPSAAEWDSYVCQHVRLVGEALKNKQANCVEGSTLFSSIFRKLSLDPFIILIPGHAFVGVYLDENHNEFICIETTMLSNSSFEDAVESGMEQYREHEKKILNEIDEKDSKKKRVSDDQIEYAVVDIEEARALGVIPIRELDAEKNK